MITMKVDSCNPPSEALSLEAIKDNFRQWLRNDISWMYTAGEPSVAKKVNSQQQRVLIQGQHLKMHPYPSHRNLQFQKSRRITGHLFLVRKLTLWIYLENDFVRALGFVTPLLNRIGIKNVSEIIVDSTFKTNQERFELFVVNANSGGYGMPLAYLYLLTSDGTELARHDPKNEIKTRVQVLHGFFISLRQIGLLPIFSLVDKDAGEISAISEAWSRIINIQLCYWHLAYAINKRAKDKKSRANAYTAEKAMEACREFEFIDPVAKNVFWSSAEIYRNCVEEIYRFCYNRNLVKYWGYLWINWYNRKDWNLFARSAYPVAMPLARTTMIIRLS